MNSTLSPMLTAKDVARILNVSVRTVWRLKSAGRLPPSIGLGRSVRWCASEFMRWMERGCPERPPWRGA